MIYVAAERDDLSAVKIGFTATKGLGVSQKAALGRLSGLQVGTWRELVLIATTPGSRKDEQDLHRQFRADWIRGEWFANRGQVSRWLAGIPTSEVRGPLARPPLAPITCRYCSSVEHASSVCEQAYRAQIEKLKEQVEHQRLTIERMRQGATRMKEKIRTTAANTNTATLRTSRTAWSVAKSTELLTDRQSEIFEFICASIQKDGEAPTMRAIGARFGISSTNGVNDHMQALRRKGYLVLLRQTDADVITDDRIRLTH